MRLGKWQWKYYCFGRWRWCHHRKCTNSTVYWWHKLGCVCVTTHTLSLSRSAQFGRITSAPATVLFYTFYDFNTTRNLHKLFIQHILLYSPFFLLYFRSFVFLICWYHISVFHSFFWDAISSEYLFRQVTSLLDLSTVFLSPLMLYACEYSANVVKNQTNKNIVLATEKQIYRNMILFTANKRFRKNERFLAWVREKCNHARNI